MIIVFEMLLWLRKHYRTWRVGQAQAWMRAHIWFGLLCLPLLILHSGFRLGGTLSTVLMVLLLIVIASGVWGLAMQQFLPTRMLDEVPSETIYSQIDHVMNRLIDEAQILVLATCGPEENGLPASKEPKSASDAAASHITIGAVRSAGLVQGKVVQTRALTSPVPGSEPLRVYFRNNILDFLKHGSASTSPLRSPERSAVMFRDLRTRLDPAAHDTIAALENMCDQRRQLDTQARLQFWLQNWLWVHLPLSVALFILMWLHVWVAIKYW
jgi:hypothetical protein